MNRFYSRLQWLALLPLALFVGTGLADEVFGWGGVLPTGIVVGRSFPTALVVIATWIEILGAVGLLLRRTRPFAALVLCCYAMSTAVLFHAFWTLDDAAHQELQAFLLSTALAGAFLYVFAAARSNERERGKHERCRTELPVYERRDADLGAASPPVPRDRLVARSSDFVSKATGCMAPPAHAAIAVGYRSSAASDAEFFARSQD